MGSTEALRAHQDCRACDLAPEMAAELLRHTLQFPEERAERAALDEFGRKIAAVFVLTYLIDGNNVRVIQRRYDLRFLTKAASPVLVSCKFER